MDITPELVERISALVTAALASAPAGAGAQAPAVLAIGEGAERIVPAGTALADIDAYGGTTRPFGAVVVAQTTCALLADMALGRDASRPACAVLHALLEGTPVYVAAEGIAHRGFKSTANPRLYAQLEDYVARIEQFGVRVMDAASVAAALGSVPEAPAAASAAPAAVPAADIEGLLTAAAAEDLVRAGKKSVTASATAKITPLARDVLRQAGVDVEVMKEA